VPRGRRFARGTHAGIDARSTAGGNAARYEARVLTHYGGNWPFALSAAVDALVVCGVVLWAVRTRPSRSRLAGAAMLAFLALAFKGIAMMAEGLERPFGVMHVAWLDLVVVVPLAAALLGVLAWRSSGAAIRGLVVLGLLWAPFGAYASFVEPSRLIVEHAQLDLRPARTGEDGFRIAVLSDIQFEHVGGHEREAVSLLMAQRPDLILLTGDYFQGSRATFRQELPAIRRLFATLHAPAGVFAVQGDQDSDRELRGVFTGLPIHLLLNATATIRVGDRTVELGGVRLRFWEPEQQAFVRRFEALPGDRAVRILIAHRPDTALQLAHGTRVDLVASGHTHGGQVQLPLIGPITTASKVPDDVAAGGLHDVGGRAVYVSRGVGVERGQAPRVRFGDPPEISIVAVR
jgi:predicted MPP superfamily phosphohydrolase